MQNAGRRASPESFTHGSSAQRVEALRQGLQSGDDTVCDAYMR
jgi:predicted metalloprotease